MQLIQILLAGLAAHLTSTASATPIPRRMDGSAEQQGVQAFVARELEGMNGGAWTDVVLQRSPADPELQQQKLAERIVYNPRILTPAGGESWTAGSQYSATWDTSDVPEELQDSTSMLKLGYDPADGAGGLNEHWTLAEGFPVTAGKVDFILPTDLEQRDDYVVVLFGDSGNISKHFSIVPASDGQANFDDNKGQPDLPYAPKDGQDEQKAPSTTDESTTNDSTTDAPAADAPANAPTTGSQGLIAEILNL